jgi:hypothetical protein
MGIGMFLVQITDPKVRSKRWIQVGSLVISAVVIGALLVAILRA